MLEKGRAETPNEKNSKKKTLWGEGKGEGNHE